MVKVKKNLSWVVKPYLAIHDRFLTFGAWDFIQGSAHPDDDLGHGTHVCGTIAQSTASKMVVSGSRFLPKHTYEAGCYDSSGKLVVTGTLTSDASGNAMGSITFFPNTASPGEWRIAVSPGQEPMLNTYSPGWPFRIVDAAFTVP